MPFHLDRDSPYGTLSAGLPHMELSQSVECGSKPLDVQFVFE